MAGIAFEKNDMDIEKQSSDAGVADGLKTVSYVADSGGNHELVPGFIWQPVNIVNRQAWKEIERQVEASKRKIAAGKVSCLHYYMTANQMDTSLLAKYTSQSRWLVLLHMVPFFFNRLRGSSISKYTEIFKVSSNDLIQGKLNPPVYEYRGYETQAVD